MPFNAGSAVSTLGLDMSDFERGMLKATSLSQLFPQTVTSFLANPLLGFASLAKTALHGLESSLGSLIGVVKEVGGQLDNLGEAAASAGVSVGFLSGVGAAAADAGSSVEGLADAMKFLNKNVGDALDGNKEMQATFRQLGVSIYDVAGHVRDGESLFYDFADALSQLPTHAQKVNAAMTVLGRSGSEMVGFLDMGSAGIRQFQADAVRLGAVATDSAAKAGDAFGTLSSYVGLAVQGIKYAVAVPVLQYLADHFTEVKALIIQASDTIRGAVGQAFAYIASHGEEIRRRVVDDARAIMDVLTQAGRAALFVADHFEAFATVIGGAVMVAAVAKTVGLIRSVITELAALRAAYAATAAAAAGTSLAPAGAAAAGALGRVNAALGVGILAGTTAHALGAGARTSIGIGGGMTTGALVGSVVPGVGTLVGTGVGGLVGAAAGLTADNAAKRAAALDAESRAMLATLEVQRQFSESFQSLHDVVARSGNQTLNDLEETVRKAFANVNALQHSVASGDQRAQAAQAAAAALDALQAGVRSAQSATPAGAAGLGIQLVSAQPAAAVDLSPLVAVFKSSIGELADVTRAAVIPFSDGLFEMTKAVAAATSGVRDFANDMGRAVNAIARVSGGGGQSYANAADVGQPGGGRGGASITNHISITVNADEVGRKVGAEVESAVRRSVTQLELSMAASAGRAAVRGGL